VISGSAGTKLQMVVRARTKGSIACLYKRWSELGQRGLLPVFTNGGQSSDKGVYCLSLQTVVRARTKGSIVLSLQMVVRARTWGSIVLSLETVGRARTRGSIACLYKRWSELGQRGLLPVFTNGG
jgi:hypothetical protein